MPNAHDERVRRISEQVRARPPGKRLTIQKAHPGHTPHDLTYKKDRHPVDVEGLNAILEIDREAKKVTLEGQVSLGQLCKETLAAGLMPKVVPEFETFTVSGLVNGLGIETSSHRHGVFPASVAALEVVLGNGDVLVADHEHHRDLLTYLPGSYGTLGIVTRVTLELSQAGAFVRSRYFHFAKRREYVAAFADALSGNEFVEGFVLGRESYVLVTGNYSDKIGGLDVFDAMTPGNPWYYQHAEELGKKGAEALVPTYEYMFRHQRGLLWIAGIIADLKIFTNTRWGRAYLDREVEKKVKTSGFKGNLPIEIIERSLINQDMGIRLSRLEEGIEYVQQNLDVHPLWNCPAGGGSLGLAFATPRKLAENPELVVDIGIYGEPKVRGYDNFKAMRALQTFVDAPSLWGVSYLTPEELRAVYDFGAYEAVQRKYHAADAFVPLEEKIRFMQPSGESKGPDRLWRLTKLWYDFKAKA